MVAYTAVLHKLIVAETGDGGEAISSVLIVRYIKGWTVTCLISN